MQGERIQLAISAPELWQRPPLAAQCLHCHLQTELESSSTQAPLAEQSLHCHLQTELENSATQAPLHSRTVFALPSANRIRKLF